MRPSIDKSYETIKSVKQIVTKIAFVSVPTEAPDYLLPRLYSKMKWCKLCHYLQAECHIALQFEPLMK